MASLRFLDGERELPDHLVARLAGMKTRTLTYDEAMDLANKRELADYLNDVQRKVVKDHFQRWR